MSTGGEPVEHDRDRDEQLRQAIAQETADDDVYTSMIRSPEIWVQLQRGKKLDLRRAESVCRRLGLCDRNGQPARAATISRAWRSAKQQLCDRGERPDSLKQDVRPPSRPDDAGAAAAPVSIPSPRDAEFLTRVSSDFRPSQPPLATKLSTPLTTGVTETSVTVAPATARRLSAEAVQAELDRLLAEAGQREVPMPQSSRS